ncbi:polymorphic transmembrane cluster 2 transmembrane protein 2, partial [Biomphalaria glabrata]
VFHSFAPASNSIYWPADSSDDLFYYNAFCEIFHKITLETVGNYTVHVSMFPSIKNNNYRVIHEINRTLNIKFEKPSVRFHCCPKEVEEDVNVNCSCKMKGYGSKGATYSWTKTGEKNLLSNTSLLTFSTEYDT